MWLKRVEIHNFQKHEQFEADFTPKVNAIIGETDRGKSCLVRAIKWVLFNEPKGDVVRREGTSKTSVILTLDNGVEVERVKSGSENAYIIRKDGLETRFDAFGKDIPEQVKKVLSAMPMEIEKEGLILNMAGQLDPPFLLTESGAFRMKVLNKLIGSDILDMVTQDLNKDILRMSREEKIVADALATGRASLSGIEAFLIDKGRVFDEANVLHEKIKKDGKEYQLVGGAVEVVKKMRAEIGVVEAQLKGISIPEGIEELRVKAVQCYQISQVVDCIRNKAIWIKETAAELGEVRVPEGLEVLKGSAGRYNTVREVVLAVKDRALRIGQTSDTIGQETRVIDEMRAKYKALLKEYGKCPVCHTETTQEVLDKIVL